MKQQIIISGRGGQGIVFLTKLIAEAAITMNLNVLTSETHGMAVRGGTVISHIKVGDFKSPLIMYGEADMGFFLKKNNINFHNNFIKKKGKIVVNSDTDIKDTLNINAEGLAEEIGSLVSTNLVLLGYAIKNSVLFCDADTMEKVILKFSKGKKSDLNLLAFHKGLGI